MQAAISAKVKLCHMCKRKYLHAVCKRSTLHCLMHIHVYTLLAVRVMDRVHMLQKRINQTVLCVYCTYTYIYIQCIHVQYMLHVVAMQPRGRMECVSHVVDEGFSVCTLDTVHVQ